MRKFALVMIGALLAQFALTTQVKADDFLWSYQGTTTSYTSGASSVTFEGAFGPTQNDGGVIIFNVNSANPNNTFDHFANQAFKLDVVIVANNDLLHPQTVEFTGTFTGDVSHKNVKNFTYSFDSLVATANVGDAKSGGFFTVTIDGYTAPGPETVKGQGSVHANVVITPFEGGGGVEGTPEPSTFVLAGLGLSGMGFYGWRRRKICLA